MNWRQDTFIMCYETFVYILEVLESDKNKLILNGIRKKMSSNFNIFL